MQLAKGQHNVVPVETNQLVVKLGARTCSSVILASSLQQSSAETTTPLSIEVQTNLSAEEVFGCNSLLVRTFSVELKNKFDGSLKIVS